MKEFEYEEDNGMDFTKCLELVLIGRKMRRTEWPDDGTYIVMIDDKVMIFTPEDGMVHPLIVSREDILATDWAMYTGKN